MHLPLFSASIVFLVCSDFVCATDDQDSAARYRCVGRYEEYNACGSSCPETCSSILINDRACAALCVPGCFCKPGYVRNRWNACIPKEKCPCKNPNEIFTCGSACQTTCATLGQECPIKNIKCNDTCYCRDGYARDSQDICISILDCPKTNT